MAPAPQSILAISRSTRSIGNLPTRVTGRDLTPHMTDFERATARNVAKEVAANSTESTNQRGTESAVVEFGGTLP